MSHGLTVTADGVNCGRGCPGPLQKVDYRATDEVAQRSICKPAGV